MGFEEDEDEEGAAEEDRFFFTGSEPSGLRILLNVCEPQFVTSTCATYTLRLGSA